MDRTFYGVSEDDLFPLRIDERFDGFLSNLLSEETRDVITASIGQVLGPFQVFFSLGKPTLSFLKRRSSHRAQLRPGAHVAKMGRP